MASSKPLKKTYPNPFHASPESRRKRNLASFSEANTILIPKAETSLKKQTIDL